MNMYACEAQCHVAQGEGACRPAARPFLKWAGGKRKLLGEIARCVPVTFGVYHEPFVGGGALFFDLEHPMSIISDANGKLITTYRAVRDDPSGVIGALGAFSNTSDCYYEVRARNFSVGSPAQRAAEFIYTNRVGFNGLYRENMAGQMNVPFGRNKDPRICDVENLRAVSAALQDTGIEHDDFSGVLKRAAPGDFVYFDPPYIPVSTTSSFTSYQAGGFGYADQVRLRDVALELKARGVHVLLSNSVAPMVLDLYKTFEIRTVEAARAINSKAEGRGLVQEVLIR
jgi:DNA adenine methylase